MATITVNSQLTLVELAKRTDNKAILDIANTLSELQPEYNSAVWLESNQPTSHVFTQTLALPSGTWRKLNDGAATSAGTTKQVTEPISILEAYSKVDKALVDMSPDPQAFRFQEDKLFLEGLGQNFWDAFFYGERASNPEKLNGLTPRYSTINTVNVQGTGGSGGDTTSIWIIQWGPGAVHFVYPRGSKTVGIQMDDRGQQTVAGTTAGTLFEAYITRFVMNVGLCVRDDRCIQRIGNIEVTGSSNIFDPIDVITAISRMPNAKPENAVMYVNRTIKVAMEKYMLDKTNAYITYENVQGGMPIMRFLGIPVVITDSLVNTETAIT